MLKNAQIICQSQERMHSDSHAEVVKDSAQECTSFVITKNEIQIYN